MTSGEKIGIGPRKKVGDEVPLKVSFGCGYYEENKEGEGKLDPRFNKDVRALLEVIEKLGSLDVKTIVHLLLATIVLNKFSAELKPGGLFPFAPATKVRGTNPMLRVLTMLLHDVGKARYMDITTSVVKFPPIPSTFDELLEQLPSLQNNPVLQELLRMRILLHQFEPKLSPELKNRFSEEFLRECLEKFKLQLSGILEQGLPLSQLPQNSSKLDEQTPENPQQVFYEFYKQFYLQVSQLNKIKLKIKLEEIWHLLLRFPGIDDQDKQKIRFMVKFYFRMRNHPLAGFKGIIDLLKKHELEISPDLLDYLLGIVLRHHSRQDSDENPRSYPKRVILDEFNRRLKGEPLSNEYEGLGTLVNFEAELSRFVDILVALFFEARGYQEKPMSLEEDFNKIFGPKAMKEDGFSQEFIDFISNNENVILEFFINLKNECDQFINNIKQSLREVTKTTEVKIFGNLEVFETVRLIDVLKIKTVRENLFGNDAQSLQLIEELLGIKENQ